MSNDDSLRGFAVAVTDNAGSPFDAPRRVMEVRPAEFTLAELLDRAERAVELGGESEGVKRWD